MTTVLSAAVAALSVVLAMHAGISLWLMLFAWDDSKNLEGTAGPQCYRPPRLSFSVLVPARHEEAVIGDTLRAIWCADYPTSLLEILIICHSQDRGTIDAANAEIAQLGCRNARTVCFTGDAVSKPRALNVGLAHAKADVVAVFDAEDDVHPGVFKMVNTVMLAEKAPIVQAGVQLMNFREHWFSIHNCLEYFFWFKSRLHLHAHVGLVPLGGNTVFFRRRLLADVGGWDEQCLTEDADIGMRASAAGHRIRVVYDSHRVTREETPHSMGGLIRQRTRWHQGFLQVLWKGDWLAVPGCRRKALAFMTLSQPLLDAALLCSLPFIACAWMFLHLPLPIALLSFLPLYGVLLQLGMNVAGVFVFGREFEQPVPWFMPLRMVATYLPYQWLLGVSALRACVRQVRRATEWEKTSHTGAHRRLLPAALYYAVESSGAGVTALRPQRRLAESTATSRLPPWRGDGRSSTHDG